VERAHEAEKRVADAETRADKAEQRALDEEKRSELAEHRYMQSCNERYTAVFNVNDVFSRLNHELMQARSAYCMKAFEADSLQSQRQWLFHQLDEASKRITLLEKTCKDQDPLDDRRGFPVCHICMERPRDVAFNCGHTVCKSCSSDQRMVACTVCRVAITTRISLYI
jgi:hypothetical protein